MAVKQMSRSQQDRFERAMVEQGVKVRRTSEGFWLSLPDGEHVAVHFTSSDVNAQRTIMRKLRRAGVVHPNDTRGATLPAYITEGTINPKTRKAVIDWYIKAGYPKEVLSQDVRAALWPTDPGRVNRALYHTGFRPEDRIKGKQRRVWIAPDDLLAMAPIPTEEMLKQGATHPLVHPVPGTIGERVLEQMKEKEREKPAADLNVPKAPVEAVVVPSPARKENIQKQGGIVPKAIPKPKRQYTEIERALAAQGKTLEDLENKVVEAATSGSAGEIVDAQAEHISALKAHTEALAEDLEQTVADEGSLNEEVERLRLDLANALQTSADLLAQNTRQAEEIEQALRMAGDAEERASQAEDLLRNVKIPIAAESNDSWVVPLGEFLDYNWAGVAPKFETLATLGLEYELRVWRKKS